MTDVTARVSKTIAAPAAAIWQALTTPQTIKHYFFGAEVESDFRVGSPIRFRGEFNGKKYEDKGEVLDVEEAGGPFRTRATVRNAYVGEDSVWRLNLMFLDAETPARLLGSS